MGRLSTSGVKLCRRERLAATNKLEESQIVEGMKPILEGRARKKEEERRHFYSGGERPPKRTAEPQGHKKTEKHQREDFGTQHLLT